MSEDLNNTYRLVNYKIVIFIIAVFLFDFITKAHHIFHLEGFSRFSAIPKLILELVLIFIIIKNKFSDITTLFFGAGILLIATAGFLMSNPLTTDTLTSQLYDINKLLYLFLFVAAINSLPGALQTTILKTSGKILIYIGAVNGIVMIIGLLTQLEIFRAYPYTERFGYNGFLVKTSEASYFYILLIAATYYEYLYAKTKPFLLLFFIAVSLLIGTKAVWLFLALLALIHFLFHRKKSIRNVSKISLLAGTVIMLLFYRQIVKLIVNSFSFGPQLYAEHGFITVLTSTRDLLLENTITHIKENWNIFNYIFGGIQLRTHAVQFEFIDLFLCFGAAGTILYLILLKRIFIKNIKQTGKHKILLLIALMLVVAFAGNFFKSIICVITFYIMFRKMNDKKEVTGSSDSRSEVIY